VTTTATVTHTAHGLATGVQVNIQGAAEPEYNGAKTITVTSANTYTYTITATTSPATGTIVATAIVLNDLTSALGIAQETGFNFTNTQPITGWVRRGTSSPRYKTTPVSGDIVASVGFSTTVFMVTDE